VAKKIKYVGSKAVNKDSLSSFSTFNDGYQTTIFNGGIKLSTKFTTAQPIGRESRIIVTQRNLTLSDLKISNLDELNNFIKVNNKLKLNFDKTKLSNYAVYGSLKEKYRVTVNNIINKFPGGLFLSTNVSGLPYNTVLDYTYNSSVKKASFRVPLTVVENPFFVNLSSFNNPDSKKIGNLISRYGDYVLSTNPTGQTYNVLEFTGVTSGNSSYLFFVVEGDPLGDFSSSTISQDIVIKPNDIEFNKFYNSLNELEKYFLNKNSKPKYSFTFKIPKVNDDGELEFSEYKFKFPLRFDGYNLDTQSVTYIEFLKKLFEVGDIYDEYKSDLILRKFVPQNLVDLDGTDSYKSESMFKIYAKEIDEIKLFFDSLMNINNVSYDKVDNINDTLIKNLARTLSWKAKNIINDKDLVSAVLGNNSAGNTEVTASLAEVDIELWRRLVINSAWFMKSKGTRRAIETLFTFIGVPECLISFNENVYVVNGKINPSNVDLTTIFNLTPNELPPSLFDDDGYPVAPIKTNLYYFQKNGNEDSGQYYIDLYRKVGFDVTRTVDNKKSWVYYESANTHSSVDRDTLYQVDDSRLIINTKEVSISIDIAKAIECDVYNFNKTNNYPVSNSGRTSPYPQRESNNFSTSGLTFGQYIENIYSAFINVQNRKVSDSAIGSYYPSLTKLYYDYLNESFNDIGVESNKRRFRELLDYVVDLDSIFDDFVRQFIPATTILIDGGTKIRNTIFTPQKFVYKQGIDDGSEFSANVNDEPFEDKQDLIQIETTFFDEYADNVAVATLTSDVNFSRNGNIDTDTFTKVYTPKFIAPVWDAKVCETTIPTFAMTGGTKIELSSLTNNSLYSRTTGNSHTIIFNFTSGTETLTASTTEFLFNIHQFDRSTSVSGFSDTPIYTFSATSTAFTTSNTITIEITSSTLQCDSEYIIKPYYKLISCFDTGNTGFSAISPYTYYESLILSGYNQQYPNSPRFLTISAQTYTGNSLSTLISNTAYTPTFRNYNSSYDYYFTSFCNAELPTLGFPIISETQGLTVESTIINVLTSDTILTVYEPVGDVVIAVNGITLLKGIEYFNDTSIPVESLRNRTFKLAQTLTVNHADVVTVTYYRNQNSQRKIVKEDFQYTGSTNISANPITLRYEITLNYERELNSDIVIYWNGILLTEGSDYDISVFDKNKIVLSSDFTLNPAQSNLFSIYYFTDSNIIGDVIDAGGPIYQINWTIPNIIRGDITGNFTHEFYDITNTGFTGTTVYSINTPYLYDTSNYSQLFAWQDIYPTLVYGASYIYRISSTKYFKTINNITISSVTYSDNYVINIPS
jgi:hypothetical protein